MSTNFDLAPPVKTVDGLLAVPIDIQHIIASLIFDGATSSGTGDATIEFIVGPSAGCPIFDLRQTITAVWLDGMPLTTSDVALHNFGGGVGADLRVVNSVLSAGSSHTLRVTFTLGSPQASTAGSYQPAIAWTAGPRLTFNFGFTDLGPGRYLESWIPANLIFDQFDLTLELQILNTTVAHAPITNGRVTPLGTNHWRLSFPERFTALSMLVEVRATDSVISQTGTVILPGSGVTVTIEAWKLVGSVTDLTARIADIANLLIANEGSTGRYLHGDRYVAFLHVGGMEYEGGTTTGVGSLRHETFHSWWGRGLKPASQADGWLDEAWTVYTDLGASGSQPFNFSLAPVELSSRNPWVRVTPSASYSSGELFFEGVAALIGASNLRALMAMFYAQHHARPVTTVQLEEFLIAHCSDPSLVDAFHRFVYGFSDPSPVSDLWIKDDPGHSGSHLWAGAFWNSPDLWVRNNDDGGTSHQYPEYGQDNWFYARVRNRSVTGSARHFVVTFTVKPWAGTEFVYPGDFLPCTAAAVSFDLGPGGTSIIKARWPRALVPPAGTHVCWLAAVLTRSDRPGSGLHVWEHNNLAQKNLTVVDLAPNRWFILPFVIDRWKLGRSHRIEFQLRRPRQWEKLEVALLHEVDLFETPVRSACEILGVKLGDRQKEDHEHLECGGITTSAQSIKYRLQRGVGVRFQNGRTARIAMMLPGRGQLTVGLALRIPANAPPLETASLDLLQLNGRSKQVTGGLGVMLRTLTACTRSSR